MTDEENLKSSMDRFIVGKRSGSFTDRTTFKIQYG